MPLTSSASREIKFDVPTIAEARERDGQTQTRSNDPSGSENHGKAARSSNCPGKSDLGASHALGRAQAAEPQEDQRSECEEADDRALDRELCGRLREQPDIHEDRLDGARYVRVVPKEQVITGRQAQFSSWSMYLLIDVVVLNLFVEFNHSVVIDSFYISILTAVLFRLLLGATFWLEHRVSQYFGSRAFKGARAISAILMFLILFTSKFVILEVVDIVFGDHVSLGGFLEIVIIAVTLVVAEASFRVIFDRLGRRGHEIAM